MIWDTNFERESVGIKELDSIRCGDCQENQGNQGKD
jgi:hypothetical protein